MYELTLCCLTVPCFFFYLQWSTTLRCITTTNRTSFQTHEPKNKVEQRINFLTEWQKKWCFIWEFRYRLEQRQWALFLLNKTKTLQDVWTFAPDHPTHEACLRVHAPTNYRAAVRRDPSGALWFGGFVVPDKQAAHTHTHRCGGIMIITSELVHCFNGSFKLFVYLQNLLIAFIINWLHD